jgi:hypothetical protein
MVAYVSVFRRPGDRQLPRLLVHLSKLVPSWLRKLSVLIMTDFERHAKRWARPHEHKVEPSSAVKAERHHYVPEWYQRRFIPTGAKDNNLW